MKVKSTAPSQVHTGSYLSAAASLRAMAPPVLLQHLLAALLPMAARIVKHPTCQTPQRLNTSGKQHHFQRLSRQWEHQDGGLVPCNQTASIHLHDMSMLQAWLDTASMSLGAIVVSLLFCGQEQPMRSLLCVNELCLACCSAVAISALSFGLHARYPCQS